MTVKIRMQTYPSIFPFLLLEGSRWGSVAEPTREWVDMLDSIGLQSIQNKIEDQWKEGKL